MRHLEGEFTSESSSEPARGVNSEGGSDAISPRGEVESDFEQENSEARSVSVSDLSAIGEGTEEVGF
jgi:hypothetical protein